MTTRMFDIDSDANSGRYEKLANGKTFSGGRVIDQMSFAVYSKEHKSETWGDTFVDRQHSAWPCQTQLTKPNRTRTRPAGGKGTSAQKLDMKRSIGKGASMRTILYSACTRGKTTGKGDVSVFCSIKSRVHSSCKTCPYQQSLSPQVKEGIV